ncbi:Ku protein [Piscinibacter koreensis]|uniref:Ku protein n=1 Tax=Piscinibacter koreensis TaxID=2742824 RepID=A0A7Y6TXP2_9BURK|nr:Ku protein [Schlegelella koreensis]NUZ07322.1 Ku protein [Schlegelella koreensis]
MPDAKAAAAPVRPFWSGTITFGLVSIPVDLLAAARPRRKSMKLVDAEGHALGRRYYCPKHDKVLGNDELVRGYETESGKMVVITDEEFESAAPEKSRDIELRSFVPLDAIPPSFFDRPYFLAPDERAGKAYALLAQTMERAGKAGIGSFVMRSHEYLVAILAENGMLRAEVLRYADEVRTPETIGLPAPVDAPASLVRELGKAIDALAEDALDPAEMEDLEAGELRKFAEGKAKSGQGVISLESLEDPDDDGEGGGQVIDLVALLRKSLGTATPGEPAGAAEGTAAAKKAGRAGPARAPGSGGAASEAPAKTPAAKKAAAKKAPAKATAENPPTNKAPTKKAPVRKVAAKKASAAIAPAKKAAAKKSGAKTARGAGATSAAKTVAKKSGRKAA